MSLEAVPAFDADGWLGTARVLAGDQPEMLAAGRPTHAERLTSPDFSAFIQSYLTTRQGGQSVALRNNQRPCVPLPSCTKKNTGGTRHVRPQTEHLVLR